MVAQKEHSTAFSLFGVLLWAGAFMAFEMILWTRFGWEIAALPPLAFLTKLGYDVAWPPANGNAGTNGNGTGTGYVIELNPDDPDAGLPRRGA